MQFHVPHFGFRDGFNYHLHRRKEIRMRDHVSLRLWVRPVPIMFLRPILRSVRQEHALTDVNGLDGWVAVNRRIRQLNQLLTSIRMMRGRCGSTWDHGHHHL